MALWPFYICVLLLVVASMCVCCVLQRYNRPSVLWLLCCYSICVVAQGISKMLIRCCSGAWDRASGQSPQWEIISHSVPWQLSNGCSKHNWQRGPAQQPHFKLNHSKNTYYTSSTAGKHPFHQQYNNLTKATLTLCFYICNTNIHNILWIIFQ